MTVKIDVPGGDDAEKTRKDVEVKVDDFSHHDHHDHPDRSLQAIDR